jgi:hypothetical protein
LTHAVASARPDVVIHQLTDLPKDLDPREMGGFPPPKAALPARA